jgi:branched-chain amino acid transport system ATP-binding protein
MSEPHIESTEWADETARQRVDEPIDTSPRRPADEASAGVGTSRSTAESLLLEVDNVTLRFGGVLALDQVSFAIREGEIFGLIGPNGAGKTTCFNAMTGIYRPTAGDIRFTGRQPATSGSPESG